MWIKKAKNAIAVILAAAMIFTFPSAAFAYDALGDLPKEITVNDMVFYDIYGGAKTGRADTTDELTFLAAVMKQNDLLENWAGLAYTIYRDNPVSYHDHSGKGFDVVFGAGHYFDLVNALLSKNALQSTPSGKNDLFMSTGLTAANSLKDVETQIGLNLQKTVSLMSNKVRAQDFTDYSPVDALHDDKVQTVLYTMAAGSDQWSLSTPIGPQTYSYDCFGIAFYDFKISLLIDEQPYNTAYGDMPLDDAIKNQDKIKGFSCIQEGGPNSKSTSYTENDATSMVTKSSTKGADETMSVANTIANSKTYSFSNAVSVNTNIGFSTKLPGWGINSSVGGSVGFTATQALETAYSKETSKSTTISSSDTVSADVPPQTALSVDHWDTVTTLSSTYDCPIGITYRAVIFSVNGNAGSSSFSDYSQSSFYTVFGNDRDIGISDSVTNLNNRALKTQGVENYELSGGITSGHEYQNKKAKKSPNITALDWNSMKKRGPVVSPGVTMMMKKDSEIIAKDLTRARPMSVTGGIMKQTDSISTFVINDFVPLYPLTRIKPAKDLLSYELKVGDELRVDTIALSALNKNNVKYYGFDSDFGTWKLVNEKFEPLSKNVAEINNNQKSNQSILTANGAGKGYITYEINENTYTAKTAPSFATKSSVTPPYIPFAVAEPPKQPFTGTVAARGSITITAGDDPIDINDIPTVEVTVEDATGKEVDADVDWEAKELPGKGILVSGNMIKATAPGTFNVRAVYEGVYSGWIPVTALPPQEIEEPEADEDIDDPEDALNPDDPEDPGDSDDIMLTRGDIAVILHQLIGDGGITGETGFTDVDLTDRSDFYKEAVAWACQNGIMNGMTESQFGPEKPLTKEQSVAIMHNVARHFDIEHKAEASDAAKILVEKYDASPWAKDILAGAITNGWITEEYLQMPKDAATTDYIDIVIDLIPEDGELTEGGEPPAGGGEIPAEGDESPAGDDGRADDNSPASDGGRADDGNRSSDGGQANDNQSGDDD